MGLNMLIIMMCILNLQKLKEKGGENYGIRSNKKN